MSSTKPEGVAEVSQDLQEWIDRRVREEVDNRFREFQEEITREIDRLRKEGQPAVSDRVTLVVFSGEMDKVFAAFAIATGAAAMGMEVSMFFTFWGLSVLKVHPKLKGKNLMEKAVSLCLPSGPDKLGTSNMNFGGLGAVLFKKMMKEKNVESLSDLVSLAGDLGVKMTACQMSMDVLGIQTDELLEGLEVGGVATYLADASDSKVTLFI